MRQTQTTHLMSLKSRTSLESKKFHLVWRVAIIVIYGPSAGNRDILHGAPAKRYQELAYPYQLGAPLCELFVHIKLHGVIRDSRSIVAIYSTTSLDGFRLLLYVRVNHHSIKILATKQILRDCAVVDIPEGVAYMMYLLGEWNATAQWYLVYSYN